MKIILTIFLTISVSLVHSQNLDSIHSNQTKKYTHTIFLGQPTNFETGGNPFQISAHYSFGFINQKNKNREIQLGYRLNTNKPKVGFFNFLLTSNSQVFYLQYGGRNYFSTKDNSFKPYFNWHIGLAVLNFEDGNQKLFGIGNTIPLPVASVGLYSEIGQRFEIGITLEGLLPAAYLRLGYKLY